MSFTLLLNCFAARVRNLPAQIIFQPRICASAQAHHKRLTRAYKALEERSKATSTLGSTAICHYYEYIHCTLNLSAQSRSERLAPSILDEDAVSTKSRLKQNMVLPHAFFHAV